MCVLGGTSCIWLASWTTTASRQIAKFYTTALHHCTSILNKLRHSGEHTDVPLSFFSQKKNFFASSLTLVTARFDPLGAEKWLTWLRSRLPWNPSLTQFTFWVCSRARGCDDLDDVCKQTKVGISDFWIELRRIRKMRCEFVYDAFVCCSRCKMRNCLSFYA